MTPLLLLFDIDGTLLLRASEEHAAAVLEALRDVHGLELDPARVAGIEAAGRTDAEIARQVLAAHDIPPDAIDARAAEVVARVAQHYARMCPADLSAKVNPGMREVLDALVARDDVLLSLVTGNIEQVARRKLAAAGLGRFFAEGQGGFGSDHEDRRHLPAVARRRAGGHPPERTVVIGDTPRDIFCARADDARVIALATGPYAPDALRAADVVVEQASDLPAAIDALA